jgi:hypothetical protein
MIENRYFKEKHFLRNDKIHDWTCHKSLNTDETVELLNRLEKDRQFLKELKIEYKRVSRILDDFMDITNKLQANPDDATSQMIARDMLMMMGEEVLK